MDSTLIRLVLLPSFTQTPEQSHSHLIIYIANDQLVAFSGHVIIILFTGDGKKLADVGLDDDHSICVWDWKKEEKLASTRGHKDMIFVLEWNPFNPNYLVSVGEKHIKFWTQKSNFNSYRKKSTGSCMNVV